MVTYSGIISPIHGSVSFSIVSTLCPLNTGKLQLDVCNNPFTNSITDMYAHTCYSYGYLNYAEIISSIILIPELC